MAGDRNRQKHLAGEALKYTKLGLLQKLPYLAGALMLPTDGWSDTLSGMDSGWGGASSGTDGERFFWNPAEVCGLYAQFPAGLERQCLHLLMHGLYLHPFRHFRGNRRAWDLACDICAEYRIDRMGVPDFAYDRLACTARNRSYRRIWEAGVLFSERSVARWISGLGEEDIRKLEEIFGWDSHDLWEECPKEGNEERPLCRERMSLERLAARTEAAHRWRAAFEQAELRQAEHRRQAGESAGTGIQAIVLEKEGGYDYRRFLKRFMQEREEMYLDTDSFDYIPYDYSRRMYERLLFIEPLEYKEMRKWQ